MKFVKIENGAIKCENEQKIDWKRVALIGAGVAGVVTTVTGLIFFTNHNSYNKGFKNGRNEILDRIVNSGDKGRIMINIKTDERYLFKAAKIIKEKASTNV